MVAFCYHKSVSISARLSLRGAVSREDRDMAEEFKVIIEHDIPEEVREEIETSIRTAVLTTVAKLDFSKEMSVSKVKGIGGGLAGIYLRAQR
jgi:hypothetical protein